MQFDRMRRSVVHTSYNQPIVSSLGEFRSAMTFAMKQSVVAPVQKSGVEDNEIFPNFYTLSFITVSLDRRRTEHCKCRCVYVYIGPCVCARACVCVLQLDDVNFR